MKVAAGIGDSKSGLNCAIARQHLGHTVPYFVQHQNVGPVKSEVDRQAVAVKRTEHLIVARPDLGQGTVRPVTGPDIFSVENHTDRTMPDADGGEIGAITRAEFGYGVAVAI